MGIKKGSAFATRVQELPTNILERLERFSSSYWAKKRLVFVFVIVNYYFIEYVREKDKTELIDAMQETELDKDLTVAEMRDAELEIIRSVQKHNFDNENLICSLKAKSKPVYIWK